MIILQVSEQTAAGVVPVGNIKLPNAQHGTLQLLRTDAAGRRLELAWQEITKQKQLLMAETRPIERQGENMRAYGERVVSPSDEDFPWAVYDYLERKYGFIVEVKK